MDTVKLASIWIGIGAATSPIWGAILWLVWEGNIRPRLIPRAEIDSLATEMIARHGPSAGEVAAAEEEAAWRNSRPFEQGKWRRVRKRVERLETSAKNEDCAGRRSPRN